MILEPYTIRWEHKGCGVILVDNAVDREKFLSIVKRVDDFEYGYLSDEIVEVYRPQGHHFFSYYGKFEPSEESWTAIVNACKGEGVEFIAIGVSQYSEVDSLDTYLDINLTRLV